MSPGIVVALSLLVAGEALADAGVIEINQACAVRTGCLATDAPGFPVTISTAGSYRLTGNLSVPTADLDAIDVETSDANLDLGGFTIRGPNTCGGAPTVCALSGIGIGVRGQGDRLLVANGGIVGMGSVGLFLHQGDGHVVRNLRVAHNGLQGIWIAGSGAIIADNTASRNGDIGILVGSGATVSGNTTTRNGGSGILASVAASISRNSAVENGGHGIESYSASVISGNSASLNAGDGIQAGTSSVVSDNAVRQNGGDGISTGDGSPNDGSTVSNNLVHFNSGHGIETGVDSLVKGNGVSRNVGFGLHLGPGAGYRENVLGENQAGTVDGGGTNMGDNVCNGATTCP